MEGTDVPQPEQTIIEDLPHFKQAAPVPRSRIHTSTPVRFRTETYRRRNILSVIQELFDNNGGKPIKIEELCSVVNRATVAIAFHDLLSTFFYITL